MLFQRRKFSFDSIISILTKIGFFYRHFFLLSPFSDYANDASAICHKTFTLKSLKMFAINLAV